jgi:hypothetical protein
MSWSSVAEWMIKSTPNVLRAAVVVVLLSLVLWAATVVSLAFISGRQLEAWGLKIEEYKSPAVQKCAILAGTAHEVVGINADALSGLNTQILLLREKISSNRSRGNEINNAQGYASVADRYRSEADEFQKQVDQLLLKQDDITKDRLKFRDDLRASCS